jgi:phage terminase small subunit
MDGTSKPPLPLPDEPPKKRGRGGGDMKAAQARKPAFLTPRRQRFIIEYCKDFNGSQAAVRAGFTPKAASQSANMLLKVPEIRAEIEIIKKQQIEDIGFTARDVLVEIVKIARANIQDYTDLDEDGMLTPNFSKATRDQLASIASVESEVYIDGRGEEGRTVKRMRFRQHNKEAALKYLAQHYGLLLDRTDLSNADGSLTPPPTLQINFIKPPPSDDE